MVETPVLLASSRPVICFAVGARPEDWLQDSRIPQSTAKLTACLPPISPR